MGLSCQDMVGMEINAALHAARAEPSLRGQCQALAWIARHVKEQKHVRKTVDATASSPPSSGNNQGARSLANSPSAWLDSPIQTFQQQIG